jgi:hypothetical protein
MRIHEHMSASHASVTSRNNMNALPVLTLSKKGHQSSKGVSHPLLNQSLQPVNSGGMGLENGPFFQTEVIVQE